MTPTFWAPEAVPRITLTSPVVRMSSIQKAAMPEYPLAG
jgi:hypothetical protein